MKDTLTWFDRLKLAKFVMTADRFTQGEKVEEFENEWSRWLGVRYSLFVTSGSTANFLLLDAVKEKYFKNRVASSIKVLVPACTWVTNVNPVFQLGMTPVFCDVNLRDFSFDFAAMKEIKKQHDIDIVFVTHLLGLPAKLEDINEVFPNAILLEDVCESHGAVVKSIDWSLDRKAGYEGLGSTFSFYYGHHMSTIEGGMVSTCDPELYDLMKMKRSHGMSRLSKNARVYEEENPGIDSQFLFVTAGYNFRNTELAAVLGLSQLKKLNKFIAKRRDNFDMFLNYLPSDHFVYPRWEGNSSFCFPLIAYKKQTKNRLIHELIKNGIEYRPIVGGNLLRQPYLAEYDQRKYPNADLIHENGIYIGNNQFVGEKEMKLLDEIMRKVTK